MKIKMPVEACENYIRLNYKGVMIGPLQYTETRRAFIAGMLEAMTTLNSVGMMKNEEQAMALVTQYQNELIHEAKLMMRNMADPKKN